MELVKRNVMLILCLLMTGCSISHHDSTPEFETSFSEPNRIRFSGKGAGAGMMLMSSMGPMGIAVGVAIDEGIAKDIAASMERKGLDITKLIVSELHRFILSQKMKSRPNKVYVEVTRYGFKLQPGAGDRARVELDFRYKFDAGDWQSVRLQDEVDVTQLPTEELDIIKTDGAASYKLVKRSLAQLQ